MLWYDFQPFTDLYLTLYDGLQKLSFAPEALLGMDALIPREKSIVDVLTLDRLGADADDTLQVRPKQADGRAASDAELPRSLICALTAELSVAIAEKPWDFFDHTDLLDFPGARSRLKLANLADVAKAKGVAEGANPLRELLLRGKVAYLFQRYSAERELSAILLCIPDGNQEVRDLSDMMTAWIDQTIGATPADRAKQKNALFLVLTKMDREFEQKAGETEELRKLRWSARLNNSLINNFRGEWPANWDGQPFDNTFWLRNPTVIDERLMDYDAGREQGIAEAFAARAVELRGHFMENADVQRHFADPARAWDEAFRANDGGVAYLVKSLTPVCDPAIKRAQVRGQLEIQIRRLVDRLAGFHSAADGDSRAKKRDLVHTVLRGLSTCIQQQLFGELMAALQIADAALREIYFRISTARPADEANGRNGKPPAQVAQSTGAAVDLGAIFADVFGEEPGRSAPPSGVLEDRAERFAREAAEYWLENMRRVGADEKALSHFGVDRQHLGWLIDELVVGAHRLKLIDQLSHEVRDAGERRQRQVGGDRRAPGAHRLLGAERLCQRAGLRPSAARPAARPAAQCADAARVRGPDDGQRRAQAQRGPAADLRRLLQGLDAGLPAARHGQCRLRGRPRDHAGAERPAGRHPARRAGLGGAVPIRASVESLPEPGYAILRISDLDAAPEGLAISIQRQQGPDSHLADDGWRRTEAWLLPEQGRAPSGDAMEFHLGPEICDRLAGIATVRAAREGARYRRRRHDRDRLARDADLGRRSIRRAGSTTTRCACAAASRGAAAPPPPRPSR